MTQLQSSDAPSRFEVPTPDQVGVACDEIERIAAPSVDEFFRTYVRKRRPVVVTGLTEGWRDDRWTPEGLAAAYGDTRVIAAPLRNGTLAESNNQGVRFRYVRLRDFVDSLTLPGSATDYIMAPTWDFPPGLQQDYRTPAYCDGSPYMQAKVWVGKAGTVTPMHRDVPHNFHVHLLGRKRWILFSPRQSSQVYPRSPFSGMPNFAQTDPERPDYERFPRLRDAKGLACICNPGDTLYIPSGWWHYTRSMDDIVSMNFWWGGRVILAATRLSQVFKRIRQIQRGEWA